jgi:hypothetical protein
VWSYFTSDYSKHSEYVEIYILFISTLCNYYAVVWSYFTSDYLKHSEYISHYRYVRYVDSTCWGVCGHSRPVLTLSTNMDPTLVEALLRATVAEEAVRRLEQQVHELRQYNIQLTRQNEQLQRRVDENDQHHRQQNERLQRRVDESEQFMRRQIEDARDDRQVNDQHQRQQIEDARDERRVNDQHQRQQIEDAHEDRRVNDQFIREMATTVSNHFLGAVQVNTNAVDRITQILEENHRSHASRPVRHELQPTLLYCKRREEDGQFLLGNFTRAQTRYIDNTKIPKLRQNDYQLVFDAPVGSAINTGQHLADAMRGRFILGVRKMDAHSRYIFLTYPNTQKRNRSPESTLKQPSSDYHSTPLRKKILIDLSSPKSTEFGKCHKISSQTNTHSSPSTRTCTEHLSLSYKSSCVKGGRPTKQLSKAH